jgi:hypothetical protein
MSTALRCQRRFIATLCFTASAAVWVGGCGKDNAINGPQHADKPAIASNAVRKVGSVVVGGSLLASAAVETDVSYITLPPGSAPDGRLATIGNLRTGDTVVVVVGAGGFDPTPIVARAGDTISVVVRDVSSNVVLQPPLLVVAARRPPVVVRTYPPVGKRDVPLNTRISVVFSEPIDTATLTNASVQLRQGSTVVSGQLEFRDSEHVAVVFVPTDPLSPASSYTLNVSPDIRDLDGDFVEGSVSVAFTTATSAAFAQYRVSIAQGEVVQVGDTIVVHLTTQVWDPNVSGLPGVEGAVARFQSSTGTVAPDTTTSGLDGLTNVVWKFAGILLAGSETAQLSACASNSPTRCDLYRPLITLGYGPP